MVSHLLEWEGLGWLTSKGCSWPPCCLSVVYAHRPLRGVFQAADGTPEAEVHLILLVPLRNVSPVRGVRTSCRRRCTQDI